MLAQKTAEETQETALRNAHAIEKEAMTKSEILVSDAKRELERIHQKIVQLCQQYETYKLQFKNLAKSQMELLESESFQIHVMDLPTVELDSLTTSNAAAAQEEEPEFNEEDLPKIDISFTNVASDAE